MSIAEGNYPLAERIKEIISEKGLKQYFVAYQAGIPKDLFSAMLNGRKSIKPKHIPGIAKALNSTPNDLFDLNIAEKSDQTDAS